jgi:hypothetical protein
MQETTEKARGFDPAPFLLCASEKITNARRVIEFAQMNMRGNNKKAMRSYSYGFPMRPCDSGGEMPFSECNCIIENTFVK